LHEKEEDQALDDRGADREDKGLVTCCLSLSPLSLTPLSLASLSRSPPCR